MFTDRGQAVINLAKDYAFSSGSAELNLPALLAAVGSHAEAGVLLAECAGVAPDKLRAACPHLPDPVSCPGTLPLGAPVREILVCAKELADDIPDRFHPGLIDLRHLVCAIAASREACNELNVVPMLRDGVEVLLASWYENEAQAPRLDELTERLRAMRDDLLTRVFGQDHAVHAFVEGLFNAEVVASADSSRTSPRAVFVFAGPPGVGKTYLAELGASYLERPFTRFDMSAYSEGHEHTALVGLAKGYQNARSGALTGFVEKNPNAVLLFDEIEKSSPAVIHLFLQLLDAGRLEDKFLERNVSFRDTTIIFTTNAGRRLYDSPNQSGVHVANAAFHRRTILDALENERDPTAPHEWQGRTLFPPAICSRLATGYPVLFNHLRVNELERVVQAELGRMANLLERQYYKRATFDELLSMCLVLREGARADARTLRSQTESFVKTELFKFCRLFRTDRLEEVFEEVDRIHFMLDDGLADLSPEVRSLFEPQDRPRILLVADPDLVDLYTQHLPEVDWRTATAADDALQVLAEEEVDMVLLDLWLGRSAAAQTAATAPDFDLVPAASRRLDKGQAALRKIRDRLPAMPVYLLSLADPRDDADEGSIDDELFTACVRGGGARGMVVSRFTDPAAPDGPHERDRFAASLVETCRRLHREKAADRMGQQRMVLSFDTIPDIHRDQRAISIRLRNLRLTRAIAAADAGEVLDDVERPATRFDDVVGADEAKDELRFFIDYLKNPRRYAALGLEPPKGVLLHGPPGTGKTLLARAMAGESDVAFISKSAASFVTVWQGSGPQAVRDLFAQARRYAPAIIFIDEIDAIGKERTGATGVGHGQEQALNQLLTEMDGFTSPSPDRPVFVLAATNFDAEESSRSQERGDRRRKLDAALARRFTRKIKVDYPKRADREQYLSLRLRSRQASVVTDAAVCGLAERSSHMTLSDLARVIDAAGRSAAKAGGPLTDRILEDAFETVCYGEAGQWDAEQVRRAARHEAGHAVMYWLSGWWPSYVTVVSRGDHGGYMAHSAAEEDRHLQTRDDLLAGIRTSLGGRAAELLYYGDASTGPSGDMRQATRVAQRMVCELGMDDDFGLAAIPELLQLAEGLSSPMHAKLNEAVNKILARQMDETVKHLEANRPHLDAVAEALIQRERLNTDELKQILPPLPAATATV